MAFISDNRAQSIQVGAVLLFGVLVVFFALWQSVIIPNQNEQVEFDHNQQVQGEVTELRSAVVAMADSATTRSTSVRLGARYPPRLISLNPGPASGTLQTVGTAEMRINASISNATAVGETGDFWNGTQRLFNTGALAYSPRYNIYANPPETVLENSVAYNGFENGRTLPLTEQLLVDDQRIQLGMINGSLSLDQIDTASVDFQPVSTQTRTVSVANTTGGNVTIELPTRLDEDTWRDLLDEQRTTGYVHNITVSEGNEWNTLRIEMQSLADVPIGSYQLRLWKVGVGTGVTQTSAEYLTDIAGGEDLVTGQQETFVVEARDEFNGPQSGVTVNASASSGTLERNQMITDDEGQATFIYTAPNSTEDNVSLNLSLADTASINGTAPEDVQFEFSVIESGTGGGTSGSAPSISASAVEQRGQGNNVRGTVDLDLTNNGESSATITRIRIDDTTANVDEIDNEVQIGSGTTDVSPVPIPSGTIDLTSSVTISPGETVVSTFDRFFGPGNNGNDGGVDMRGESFTFTLFFENRLSVTLTVNV